MKHKRFQLLYDAISGLTILAIIGALALAFLAGAIKLLSGIKVELATAIIATSATVLASIIALVISKHIETTNRLKQEIRIKKSSCIRTVNKYTY